MNELEYVYNAEKNKELKERRGINLEDVIIAIEKEQILDIRDHHNLAKYPDQKIIIIEIHQYVYQVPFIEKNGQVFLKTVYPSRKATAVYMNRSNGASEDD